MGAGPGLNPRTGQSQSLSLVSENYPYFDKQATGIPISKNFRVRANKLIGTRTRNEAAYGAVATTS